MPKPSVNGSGEAYQSWKSDQATATPAMSAAAKPSGLRPPMSASWASSRTSTGLAASLKSVLTTIPDHSVAAPSHMASHQSDLDQRRACFEAHRSSIGSHLSVRRLVMPPTTPLTPRCSHAPACEPRRTLTRACRQYHRRPRLHPTLLFVVLRGTRMQRRGN